MDIEQIRQMNDEELRAKKRELKEELGNLRMQKSVAPLENPMRSPEIRKTIARINTIENERESQEASK
ncbi:MAG: 50S ribosomal protein L29 [bacterium]